MTEEDTHTPVQRRNFLKALGAGSTVALAGCIGGDGDQDDRTTTEGTNQSSDTVKIGSNHPVTGALAFTGERMQNAMKLAAQHKNDDGGIQSLGGAEVEIVTGDNEGTQELGGGVEQQLIDEGTVANQGCYSSPVTRAATQVATREQVPHVVDIAAADNVLTDNMQYAYRVSAPAQGTAQNYADMVPKVIRDAGESASTLGLFYVNNAFGQAIADHLKNMMPERNIEIVADTAYSFGASSVDTQVTNLKQADPDIVCATTYAQGGILLADAMQNQDYRPKFFTQCLSATYSDDEAVGNIGSFANGVFGNNTSLDLTKDRTAQVQSQFEEFDGREMDALVAMAYTTTDLIMEAVEKAGSDDPKDVDKALKEIHYENQIVAMPGVNFEPDTGENQFALTPVQQVRDGEIHVIHPPEFATKEANPCLNQC
jgi:branched-chain amino acid transport system substrate-binding protein